MIEVLRNKNLTTRFQILVEIANSGPGVQQRDIAKKLDITPQAVSNYISQLTRERLLTSEGRSSYRVTNEGVNWIIKTLRELSNYNTFIQRAVTNISICAALAEDDLERNQKVGLKMKGGLLFASSNKAHEATGITISGAKPGEDVGITNIEGIVPLEVGRVTILRVPGVQNGGSSRVNYNILRAHLDKSAFITSLGLESFVALRKAGAEFCRYGAVEAAIEAAKSGLPPLVVCVDNETSDLIARIEKEGISYELIDAEVNS
ncbi:MAG: winged helix-turn-helix transcriptional regulator [Dehalococcoidia bacterium]|nr:MAG: winged helix-turn-helix transcriptional regulator [Dehalococcoidia bacterium]